MKLFEYVILISGTFAQEIGEEIQYAKVTKIAHIELEVDGKSRGTIDIGLFGNEVPKTVHNFASLCEGWKNPDGEDDIVLTYDGSKIHRVSPGFIIQAGDILKGDGTGSISIYGEMFEDENFILSHYDVGWVSMANNGEDSNGSQFFILLDEAEFLDGVHVVFAKVIKNMAIVTMLEEEPLTVDPDDQEYYEQYPEDYEDELEYPMTDIRIAKCYLSDPEEEILVPLVRKVPVDDDHIILEGEEDEVDPEALHGEKDELTFAMDEDMDYPENYREEL